MKKAKYSNPRSNSRVVTIQGASVQVRNDDVNGALRKLKKILEADNRQKELSKHEYYEKPSLKKKRAKAQGKKRAAKERARLLESGMGRIKSTSLRWMKSKRKRRKVLDSETAFIQAQRNKR